MEEAEAGATGEALQNVIATPLLAAPLQSGQNGHAHASAHGPPPPKCDLEITHSLTLSHTHTLTHSQTHTHTRVCTQRTKGGARKTPADCRKRFIFIVTINISVFVPGRHVRYKP